MDPRQTMIDAALLIGHRGCQVGATQNTMPAFEAAVKAGVIGIETDLRLTSDNQIVLLHDDTHAGLCVSKTSLAQMQAVSPDTLSFDQALPIFNRFNQLQLEIKPIKEPYRSTLIKLLLARFSPSNRVIVSSFDQGVLRRVKRLAPNMSLGVLEEQSVAMMLSRAQELNAEWVIPCDSLCTKETVGQCVNQGFSVSVYTVNSGERAKQLLDWGVNTVITDDVNLGR